MEIIESEISTQRLITAMPKAELHLHLDGCLRLNTVADLAAESGIRLPVPRGRIAELCVAPGVCSDLMELLSYFATPIQVLQSAAALERVTYELCEDLSRENVRYVEIRFGPSLHLERGLSRAGAIEAVVRGWHAGRRDFGLVGGVILCAMRQLPPEETRAVAEAGLPFLGSGVVGFDLAGDEAGYPILLHRDELLWAKSAGYGMTAHAGEAAGAASVRDAVELIGVSRIGHGVHSGEDPALLRLLRHGGITLEMCPTSNVHTCAANSFREHPIALYYHDGVRVTINSDNRTVSDTTVTRELLLGHEAIGLSVRELVNMTFMALDAGFAAPPERQALRREFQVQMESLGV